MTQQSSYFSLHGFSGIFVGILGSLAIFLVNTLTDDYGYYSDGFSQLPILFIEIGVIIVSVLIITISLFIIWRRGKTHAKKYQQKLWNSISKNQRTNLLLSLVVFLAILIFIANSGYYSMIPPLLLFCYGLLLLNLSRFASKSLLPIAVAEILLAFTAYFTNYDEIMLLLIGVGILPIIYGVLTYNKSKKAIEN